VNLAWILEDASRESPDKVALIDGNSGEQVTYSEYRDRAEYIAGRLIREFDVQPGDVVATLLPDDTWHNALFFATLRAGAVFSGFNRTLGFEKFKMDADRSKVKLLIVARTFESVARALLEAGVVGAVALCDAPSSADSWTNLRSLEQGGPYPTRVPIVGVEQAAPAAINYTGGTSGVSKAVKFSHSTLGLSARLSVSYDGLTSRDTNVSFISLYHSGGMHDAVKWAITRGTIVLSGGWKADRAVELIEHYRPTWIYFLVPTMVRDLMRHPKYESLDLTGIGCLLAGEPVPAELLVALRERGMRAINAYGMTEVMSTAVFRPRTVFDEPLPPPGSSGRQWIEYCEVLLKDQETGDVITEPFVVGEVCIRGDVVTPGYFNDELRTAEAFDDQGFLHTRDIAYRDEDGFYYVDGRTDDIINSGAEKMSLLEVEACLRKHPAVMDVGVAGVAHSRFGTIPAAAVVLSEDLTEDEVVRVLDAHCLSTLERWKRPRVYTIVDAVPRTATKRTKDIRAVERIFAKLELPPDAPVMGLGAATKLQTSATAAGAVLSDADK
jgi:acyl-CoA synthetase (AMP-forming)/AMP-acid ligase II